MRTQVGRNSWGVLSPAGVAHYLSLGRTIAKVAAAHNAVVHCGRPLPEGFASLLPAILHGRPFICWTHGEELLYISSSRELRWMTREVYRRAAAVLVNSRNSERLVAGFGVDARRVWVVHPGVDTETFRERDDAAVLRDRYAPSGDLLLLSVGRLQRRKGHETVLRAMSLLQHFRPRLRYLIVGSGEEEERLRSLVSELALNESVFFETDVPPHTLPLFYAACDVFILPTREEPHDVEGFGIVFLEAAASAKPAIGGRSGGVPEAVADGETGLLVNGSDPLDVATAIRTLAESPDMRRRLGEAARCRVVRDFSWERAARLVTECHLSVAALSGLAAHRA
jgi:phosphatidylinositol alpha-1,6-mannosyltransferase